MKKIITISICIALVIMVCLPIAYAVNNQEEKRFFTVEKNQVNQGEDIIMYIHLSNIDLQEFKISISSDINTGKFDIDSKENLNVTTQSNNQISININKEELNGINQIALYYTLPQDIEIGTILTLQANIEIEDEEENVQTIKQASISIEVVQNSEEENKEDADKEQPNNEEKKEVNQNTNEQLNIENNKLTKNQEDSTSEQKTKSTSTIQTNQISNKTSQESVYNGSNNNYLTSIDIQGYDLTPIFSKTNDTYFLTVSKDVEDIDINATLEDNSANICIYGNTDLKQGENKVLISVTAENGNVRTYRIYVTRET